MKTQLGKWKSAESITNREDHAEERIRGTEDKVEELFHLEKQLWI
jgi:hypothetical protein